MNRLFGTIVGLSLAAVIATAPIAFSQSESKPPMHMHKSEMDHRSDKEVSTEYKSEAQKLREQAKSHRKLAELYRTRTPVKGTGNYQNVAKHCDRLAKLYEDAAKEAEGVATELDK